MADLATLLAESHAGAENLLEDLFRSTDPDFVARALTDAVNVRVGPIAESLFVRPGVGLVIGFELIDSRRVVLKVHRFRVTINRLAAVQQVQLGLAERGSPAPRPLSEPGPLGTGIATIEELLPGESADGHHPGVRCSIANGLADFIRAASGLDPCPNVGSSSLRPRPEAPLWGEPHDLRFDFAATESGAEWIDSTARSARDVLVRCTSSLVVAHLDWRVENLGFDGSQLTAIYDWDSVGLSSEQAAVGHSAAQFSTDWRRGHQTLPTVEDMRRFVQDYEERRGEPFTPAERAELNAANLLLCAYGARCEHSDRRLRPDLAPPADLGWGALLRDRLADSQL